MSAKSYLLICACSPILFVSFPILVILSSFFLFFNFRRSHEETQGVHYYISVRALCSIVNYTATDISNQNFIPSRLPNQTPPGTKIKEGGSQPSVSVWHIGIRFLNLFQLSSNYSTFVRPFVPGTNQASVTSFSTG